MDKSNSRRDDSKFVKDGRSQERDDHRSNPKTKGKQNRRNRKNQRAGSEPKSGSNYTMPSSGKNSSGLNDLSWYARNPRLLVAAGSFQYPYRPGMSVPLATGKYGSGAGSDVVEANWNFNIPGIVSIHWMPSVGYSNDQTDPASIAAKEIFGKVREKFSGSIEADPPDFVIYLMALDGIFSAIGSLKRIYRIIGSYTPSNYILPNGLLQALGIAQADIPTWLSSKMELYQYINELVGMTNKFICPAIMDLFNRHYWLNDNVYLDAPTPDAQMYVFVQDEFPWYALQQIETSTYAGSIIGKPLNLTSPATAYNDVRNIINTLAGSDDAYIISGYLARAYEGVPSFSVKPLDITETFDAVFSAEVLTQIENAKTAPFGVTVKYPAVRQDPRTNSILCDPQSVPTAPTSLSGAALTNTTNMVINTLINLRVRNPSAADNVIATRLTNTIRAVETDDDGNYIVHMYTGTELVSGIKLLYPSYEEDGSYTSYDISTLNLIDERTGGGPTNYTLPTSILLQYTQFDWAPILMYLWLHGTKEKGYGDVSLMGDVLNVATVTPEQMAQLHRVCIYSEFNAFTLN